MMLIQKVPCYTRFAIRIWHFVRECIPLKPIQLLDCALLDVSWLPFPNRVSWMIDVTVRLFVRKFHLSRSLHVKFSRQNGVASVCHRVVQFSLPNSYSIKYLISLSYHPGLIKWTRLRLTYQRTRFRPILRKTKMFVTESPRWVYIIFGIGGMCWILQVNLMGTV
jgi:hypothetical protein